MPDREPGDATHGRNAGRSGFRREAPAWLAGSGSATAAASTAAPPRPAPRPPSTQRRWRRLGLPGLPKARSSAARDSAWLWPYGALLGTMGIFLWPAWSTPDLLIARNDLLLQFYPWHVLFRDSLSAGEFPFWNPYTFSGVPAFANPVMGYAYPPHWALLWMPVISALNWTMGLHVLLAGLGAAWCAGRLGAGRDGQFVSGVVYALGSATTSRLWAGHLALLEGAAWLPVATGLAMAIRRRYALQALAVVVALMVFAGQPELLIFCLWWLPLWSAFGALQENRRPVFTSVGRVGIALGLGLGLAAVQIIPSAALYSVTNRAAGSSWEWLTRGSLPPWHLLGLIGPDVFGDPRHESYWAGPEWQWHDRLFYLGLVPLLAAARASGRWRWACWLSAALSVALALGHYAPWYAWAQVVLPGYQSFRIPPKHLTLAVLALALAASLGIQHVRGKRVAGAALVGSALLALGSVTFENWFPTVALMLGGWGGQGSRIPSGESMAALAAPRLLAAGAILLAVALVAIAPHRWATSGMLLLTVAELGLVLQPYRAQPTDPEMILSDAGPLREHPRAIVVGNGGSILGNFGTVLHVTQPAGYLNLFSNAYSRLATGKDESVGFDIARADVPVLSLLGYGVVIDRNRGGVTTIQPQPRAWVARCVWPGDALDVRARDFPRQACIAHSSATEREPPVPPGAASVVGERPGALEIIAEGPGWLVTAQPWYPGWSAWVDGAPAPVDVVDGALVGVPLAAGQQTITLRYLPAGLELGMAVSATAILVLIAWWCWERRLVQQRDLKTTISRSPASTSTQV